jgi:hypothetical protein
MSNTTAGIVCLLLSCLLYAALLAVPFLPFGYSGRAAAAAGLVIVGEAIFWLGCVLAGRELMVRYRHYLNPRSWSRRRSPQPAPVEKPP